MPIIEELFDGESFSRFQEIRDLNETKYAAMLKQAYDDLRLDAFEFMSPWKSGTKHFIRVMLYGALIAMKLDLSDEDTKLLLIGCGYHDLGRCDDLKDKDLGARGAIRIEPIAGMIGIEGDDLHIVQACMATSSTDADLLDYFMEVFRVGDQERCRKLSDCLRDACQFDEWRPGVVPEECLQLDVSKALLPFAGRFWLHLS